MPCEVDVGPPLLTLRPCSTLAVSPCGRFVAVPKDPSRGNGTEGSSSSSESGGGGFSIRSMMDNGPFGLEVLRDEDVSDQDEDEEEEQGSSIRLAGHSNQVTGLEFGEAESGVVLASASCEAVILWHMQDVWQGQRCGRFMGLQWDSQEDSNPALRGFKRVHAIRFDETCGRLVLMVTTKSSGSSKHVAVVVDLDTGKASAILEGHRDFVTDACFLPPAASQERQQASRRIATCSEDRTFAVWDLGDKSLLFQSSIVSSSPFNCIAATARRRGGTLAVASQDGRVRVYSWHEGGQQGGSSEQGNATSFKIAEHASIVDAVAGFKQQAAERRRASRGRTQASMSSLTISAPNQAGLASGLGNAIKAYNEVDALLEEESSNFAESPCSVLAMGLSPAFSRHPLLWLITTTGVLCVSLHSLEPVASALFGEGHGRDAGHALAVGVVARCKIGAIEEDTLAVDEEEEERAAGPPQRAVVAVASPFLPEVRVLRVSCSSSSSNSSAQAAGERALSFSQRGDLPPRSPLSNFSFASSGPKKSKPKPGAAGKVVNQSVVFHNKIKSSGYGVKSKPKKFFTPQINRSSSSKSKSKSKNAPASGKLYPMDCDVIASPQPQHKLEAPLHSAAICRVAFSGDASRVLTSSFDATLRVSKLPFSKHQGAGTLLLTHKAPVKVCAWGLPSSNAAGSLVMSGSEDRTVCLWRSNRSEPLVVISHTSNAPKLSSAKSSPKHSSGGKNAPFEGSITEVSFFRRDKFALISCSNKLRLFKFDLLEKMSTQDDLKRMENKRTGKYKCVMKHELQTSKAMPTFAAINSFNSTLVLCASGDRTISVIDCASGGQVVRTIQGCHSKPVHRIAVREESPYASSGSVAGGEHEVFATSAADGTVKLWDIRSPRCVRLFEGHVNRTHPIGICFSPCFRFIACGSEDKACYIYDVLSGSRVSRLSGSTDVVSDVSYSPVHPQLVTCSYDGRLRFYTTP